VRAPLTAAGLIAAAGLLSLGAAPAPAASGIVLQSPIGCVVGEVCQIQQYFDHDPGSGAKDYRCGGETYDKHDGTDIRVPDMAAVRRGVPVLAAAAGRVRGGRDGMDDINVARIGQAAVANRECGNGVVVVHDGGWETQYCHMRKGSVRVKAGDPVAAGQVLGMVGMSGDAEFPHVHLSVRHNGEKVDPFAYGTAPGACNAGTSLWTAQARAQFAYRSPALLNIGFAAGPVGEDAAEAGDIPPPGPGSPAMVVWVRVIGLKASDVVGLSLTRPDGSVMAADRGRPLDRDKAQWRMFVGGRRPAGGWPVGRYSGQVEVVRGGKMVLTQAIQVVMGK
jgi:murein DD-endopeptidase MepM/ murein hydrolase activator NlpD